MPSPISYLLAALLLLFFFFNFSHGSNANFPNSKNCPIYNCTKGPKFHYPFWKIEDSAAADQYCGYRVLQFISSSWACHSCLGSSYDSYGGITNQSFVLMEEEEPKGFDWSEKCAEKVVVTVMKEFTEASIHELSLLLETPCRLGLCLIGASLWSAFCEASGGYCGYNTTKPEFLCFCEHGYTRTQEWPLQKGLIWNVNYTSTSKTLNG
ncbi:hypothetical protein M0R45_023556 [Rubus argutus]|uniref:Wall-associated receptor kinase C-terminal domain-containing protein n=1 Tax=Rubus argutus TaxID=59490 RepID=A0AAW1WP03_RUBAR